MRLAVLSLLLCAASFAREVPLTILHTCDLHGNLLPTESYEGSTNVGGLARCATVIRQVRARQPNTLLVDAGDTLQGTPVSFLSDGQVMVKALSHLRYDAWVWGNHEFDWGVTKLMACAAQAKVPILNANLKGLPIQPYRIIEVDGVKVGIIGLNTPGIPNWSRPRLLADVQVADSVETLRHVVPAARQAGARVLILVCHQGYREGGDDHANQINAIARNFPELDAIIAGHTHRNFPEYKVGKIFYCQAGYYGIHLGRVDLVYDTERGRLVRRESQTLKMDDKVAQDGELLKLCQPELERAAKEVRVVLGEATGEIDARAGPKHETPVHRLVFEAIADALRTRGIKVDAIVHGLLESRAVLAKGPVTVADVWRLLPYENTLGICQLTEADLRTVLDENAAAFTDHHFRQVWGLRWQFDPKTKRTLALTKPDSTPLQPGERLAVVFNSYDLASGGLRWPKLRELADRPESKLIETDIQTRQVVIDYIRKRGQISP